MIAFIGPIILTGCALCGCLSSGSVELPFVSTAAFESRNMSTGSLGHLLWILLTGVFCLICASCSAEKLLHGDLPIS